MLVLRIKKLALYNLLVVINRLVDFDLDFEYLKHDFVDLFAHNLSLAIGVLARKPLKAAHEDVVFSDGLHEFLSVIRELVMDQVFHLVHAILFVALELICTKRDFRVSDGVFVLARKLLIILEIVAVTRRLLVNRASFVLPFSVWATCINHLLLIHLSHLSFYTSNIYMLVYFTITN